MPRPIEYTPWRRLLEQTIMWIILGATVGMAAMVDTQLNRLGELRQLGTIRLRLPQSWLPTDEDGDGQIQLRERGEGLTRTVTVSYESPRFSLNDLLGAAARRRVSEQTVTLPDGTTAQLRVVRRVVHFEEGQAYELETIAIVPAPGGRTLLITLEQLSFGDKTDVEASVRLMKKILQTVQFDR